MRRVRGADKGKGLTIGGFHDPRRFVDTLTQIKQVFAYAGSIFRKTITLTN